MNNGFSSSLKKLKTKPRSTLATFFGIPPSGAARRLTAFFFGILPNIYKVGRGFSSFFISAAWTEGSVSKKVLPWERRAGAGLNRGGTPMLVVDTDRASLTVSGMDATDVLSVPVFSPLFSNIPLTSELSCRNPKTSGDLTQYHKKNHLSRWWLGTNVFLAQ